MEHVREGAEKIRAITWANEPVATLEAAVVHLAQTRAMVEAAECEALAAYEASKEWKAAGAGSAAMRIAHLTRARKETIGRRCQIGGSTRPRLVASTSITMAVLVHSSSASTDDSRPKLPPVNQSSPRMVDRIRPCWGALPETMPEKTADCV